MANKLIYALVLGMAVMAVGCNNSGNSDNTSKTRSAGLNAPANSPYIHDTGKSLAHSPVPTIKPNK